MNPPLSLLLRQVNRNWVRNGRITSQVFKPTSKDSKKLSVYDGSKITAAASHRHYTISLGFDSVGVVAVSVGECQQQQVLVVPDPQPNFTEHVIIDFSKHTNSDIKKKAKLLTVAATKRGWQYESE